MNAIKLYGGAWDAEAGKANKKERKTKVGQTGRTVSKTEQSLRFYTPSREETQRNSRV